MKAIFQWCYISINESYISMMINLKPKCIQKQVSDLLYHVFNILKHANTHTDIYIKLNSKPTLFTDLVYTVLTKHCQK
jgi:phosphoribosyl-ATP pyrophosphohydrolase